MKPLIKYSVNLTSYLILFLLVPVLSVSAATEKKQIYKDDDIYLRFIQLTPAQIGSFYEGREFSKAAVDKLMSSCYVTVIIKNKSKDILWLDISAWQFSSQGKKIIQQDRAYWDKQWDEINLKQAHRSTFSWTLMPAERGLYPQEDVGGRIPIPMQSKPFTVVLNFPIGENKQGGMKTVTMHNVICKQNEDS